MTGSGLRGVGISDCVADARATARKVSEWRRSHSVTLRRAACLLVAAAVATSAVTGRAQARQSRPDPPADIVKLPSTIRPPTEGNSLSRRRTDDSCACSSRPATPEHALEIGSAYGYNRHWIGLASAEAAT